jgi:predicted aldo/keto reductase-like oxidoreductase
MHERAFGNTGVSVSMLGFGAARLPETKPWRFDLERSVPVLRRAFDLGVTYIDSAHVYGAGTSEQAIGRAIQGYDRSKLYLTTKIPSSSETENRPSVWRRRLETSLRRLDTPYVDFLFLHGIEWQAFTERISRPRKALEAARKAQAEGLFRHLCFSSHDTPDHIMRLIDTGEFVGMLVQYNPLDRHNQEAIAHAARKGMGVSVMGPLAAGLLAGSAADWPGAPGVIAAEMALRYAWRNPGISVPISGMSSVEQVEHNVAAADRCAGQGEAERARWEQFFERQERLADAYCTYCGACLPCPKRVNIPENFRFMNWKRVWGMEKEARAAYARLGGRTRWEPWGKVNGRKAKSCTECGECEPRCPLGIPIMAQLRDTAAALGA